MQLLSRRRDRPSNWPNGCHCCVGLSSAVPWFAARLLFPSKKPDSELQQWRAQVYSGLFFLSWIKGRLDYVGRRSVTVFSIFPPNYIYSNMCSVTSVGSLPLPDFLYFQNPLPVLRVFWRLSQQWDDSTHSSFWLSVSLSVISDWPLYTRNSNIRTSLYGGCRCVCPFSSSCGGHGCGSCRSIYSSW